MRWEGGERSRRAQKASCAGLPSEQTDKATSLDSRKDHRERTLTGPSVTEGEEALTTGCVTRVDESNTT